MMFFIYNIYSNVGFLHVMLFLLSNQQILVFPSNYTLSTCKNIFIGLMSFLMITQGYILCQLRKSSPPPLTYFLYLFVKIFYQVILFFSRNSFFWAEWESARIYSPVVEYSLILGTYSQIDLSIYFNKYYGHVKFDIYLPFSYRYCLYFLLLKLGSI